VTKDHFDAFQNQMMCKAAQMNEAVVGTMLLASSQGKVPVFETSQLALAGQW
jgi:hypothetical protein